MIYKKLTDYTGILGAFLFIITTIIGGYLFEGYSHISQYISESYASGTEYGHLLRWIGYVPSGFFMGGFCFVIAKQFKNSKHVFYGLIGFGILYGLFTSLVSIFPCDFGCNRDYSDASFSQLLHSVLSVLTYTLTPVSLFLVGVGLKKFNNCQTLSSITLLMSLLGLIFGMVFLFNANSPIAGILQRVTESIYLFWLIFSSVFMLYRKTSLIKRKNIYL